MTGVDLYRYQTVTDYRALAGTVDYAWIKLSDGTKTISQVTRGVYSSDGQVRGCQGANIPVGGYHFAQPGDPLAQAALFLGECRRLGALDIAPALDLESPFTPSAETKAFGIAFCQAVAAAGHRPAIYMPASWTVVLRPDTWSIPGLVIWLAAYGPNDGERHANALTRYCTGRCDVHQYTSVGHLPGVSGQVDLNHSTSSILNTARKQTNMDILARTTTDPQVWFGNGVTRRKVRSTAELSGLQLWIERRGGNKTVETIDMLDSILGVDLESALDVTIDAPPIELDYARFVDDVVERLAQRLGTMTGTLTGMMSFQASSGDVSAPEPTA